MRASALRAVTNQVLAASEVTFTIGGVPVSVTGWNVTPAPVDEHGRPLGIPRLVIELAVKVAVAERRAGVKAKRVPDAGEGEPQ